MRFVLLLLLLLLPLSQINANVVDDISPLPVSYWDMDEVSGVRSDSDVVANDLTDNNTVGSVSASLELGADFENSTTEWLSITDASQTGLDITADLSVSFWINLETDTSVLNNQRVFAKGNIGAGEGAYRVTVYERNSNPTFLIQIWDTSGTDEQWVNDDEWITVGNPHHVVIRMDNSESLVSVRVDNVEATISNIGSTAVSIGGNNDAFEIGSLGGANTFDGVLDEFAFFDYWLATTSADLLWNSGTPLCYDCTGGGATTTTPITYINSYMSPVIAIGCTDSATGSDCVPVYGSTTEDWIAITDAVTLTSLVLFFLGGVLMLLLGLIFTIWMLRV